MDSDYTSIKVILYKPKPLANGEYPIKLRVTKNRKRAYVSLGFSCKIKDWNDKDNLPKKSHPNKNLIDKIISQILAEYNHELMVLKSDGKSFTPEVLVEKVRKSTQKTTVFSFFNDKIEQLISTNNIGNSKVNKDTYNQLKAFLKNKDITFSQIDYNFLLKFEIHLKSQSVSDNTISLRMRTIRAIFNAAIVENYVRKDIYPFDKFKIAERYNNNTVKRAITKFEIKKIESLTLKKNSADFEAQQYFIFSYYGLGINFVDIAHLKWNNILGDRIHYKRAKTGKILHFKLSEPGLKIIENWRVIKNPPLDDYIFSILDKQKHITPLQQHNRIHKVITRVNKSLKEIGKTAGISLPLTTYVARHSFATVLKTEGISTAIISESMGHQTEAVTQTYLKSFENSVIDDAMQNLL